MSRGPIDPALLRHSRAARAGIAALAAVGTAQALVTLGTVLVLVPVVTGLVGSGTVAAPLLWQLAGLAVGRALLAWAEQVLAVRTGARVVDELRGRLLAAVLDRGPVAVAQAGSHRLTVLLDTGLDALRPWFAGYLPALVTAVVLPPLVVLAIAVTDLASAAIVLVTLPLVPVFAVLVGRATQARAAQQQAAAARLGAHFLDVVRGLATLRLFGRAQRQVGVVADLTDQHRAATMRVLRLAFLSSTALDLVGTLSVGLVAVEAGLRVAAGTLPLPVALLVILLAPEAYRPLREVGARFHAAADASAVIAEVDAWLAPTSTAPAAAGPTDTAPTAGPDQLPDGDHGVRVQARGLRVRHPGRRRDALTLPALDVGAGELVVLRGPSGAGKTTVLRTLAGVQPLTAGRIRITGPAPLLLPQTPTLPHARTVADVIAGPGGDVVAGFLAEVGLDLPATTPLGDRGLGLSAGQRQRLALARLLADAAQAPRVVLLDEPTAHLDPEAEHAVVRALRRLADAGCAVVAVAHRPALLEAADRLVDVVPAVDPDVLPDVDESVDRPVTVAPEQPDHRRPASRPSSRPSSRPTGRRGYRAGQAVALGAASTVAGLTLTAAATWLLVRASTLPPVLSLSTAVVLVRASAVARPLLRWLERIVAHEVAFRSLAVRRSAVYAALVPRVPGPATTAGRRGELLGRIGADVDAGVDGLLRGTIPAAATGIALVTAVATAALALPAAAWVAAPGLVVAAVAGPWLAVRLAGVSTRTATCRARLSDAVVETVDAVEELAARPRTAALAVPAARSRALREAELRDAVRAGAGLALAHAGAGAATIATAAAVGAATISTTTISAATLGATTTGALTTRAITTGAITTGAAPIAATTAAVLVLVAHALGEPLLGLVDVALARRRAHQAAARLAALEAAPRTAEPAAAPADAPAADQAAAPPGLVAVRGLVAAWDPAAAPALADLDLSVPPGGRLAVTGPSGCGKSTLAAVLVGFLAPRSGTVRVGGRVALVGADAGHVFASTLRENLRPARPGADDATLRRALSAARLDGWFAGLPDGLDSWLGEGGTTLSGGELRRLLLARALLTDPDVLVLDEPTEGLDVPTAEALMADLLDASAGRTVVLLTHRPEGLDRVDEVLDLDASLVGHIPRRSHQY